MRLRLHDPAGHVLRFFAVLGGLSLWFPAVSLLKLGNVTGLQPSLLIFGMLGFGVFLLRGRVTRSMLLVTAVWLTTFVVSTLFAVDIAQAFRGSLVYFSAVLMAFAGSILVYSLSVRNRVIDGYVLGGVISSAYTIYQFLAQLSGWDVDHLLFRNGETFPLYIPVAVQGWRPYAFMPEPSYLAASLIMLSLILICRVGQSGGILNRALLVFSVLATLSLQSLSLVITLPMAIVACFVLVRDFRRGVVRLTPVWAAGAAALVLVTAVVATELADWAFGRFTNFTQSDDSFTLRTELFRIAFVIYTENPITGTGAFSSLDRYERLYSLSPQVYGYPKGVPSQFMALAAEQGSFGVLALLLMYALAWRTSRGDAMLRVLTIGCLIVAGTLVGTVLIYSIWVFVGMALGAGPALRLRLLDQATGGRRQVTQHAT